MGGVPIIPLVVLLYVILICTLVFFYNYFDLSKGRVMTQISALTMTQQ